MSQRRFETPEQAVAYMKTVAVAGSGFTRWLDVEPLRVWEGESELTLSIRPEHTQHHGFAHGAIVGPPLPSGPMQFSALAMIRAVDVWPRRCAWAAASVAGDVVTGGYTINFLAPATGTHLRAKGRVVRAGKRQVIVTAEVWSEAEGTEPKLVALAQATIIPV